MSAALFFPAFERCPGCKAGALEPCRPNCLSHLTDSNGQPLEED